MLRPQPGRMDELARGLVHRQRAQAMAEERERPVKQASHLSKQLFDEFFQVVDRIFGDAAEPTRRLDRDHLDAWVDELLPVPIDGRASTGERKAKQPKSGSGPR